jgi:hypothetical protein
VKIEAIIKKEEQILVLTRKAKRQGKGWRSSIVTEFTSTRNPFQTIRVPLYH